MNEINREDVRKQVVNMLADIWTTKKKKIKW